MKYLSLVAAISLALPSYAEELPPAPPPEPEVVRENSDHTGAIALVVLFGLIAWQSSRKSPPQFEDRPTLAPEPCQGKDGVFVACE